MNSNFIVDNKLENLINVERDTYKIYRIIFSKKIFLQYSCEIYPVYFPMREYFQIILVPIECSQ